MESTTVGIDLAKLMFSVCQMDEKGRVTQRLELKREALHGLEPRLIAAQFVKPFRKSARVKNDRNDAEVIATAAGTA